MGKRLEIWVTRLQQKVRPDEFDLIFKEYVENYKRVANQPSMRQHLIRAIKLWFRIEELDQFLDTMELTEKEWYRKNMLLLKMINQWSILLTRMGTTYTSQQYIPTDQRGVESAKEFYDLENKMNAAIKEKQKLIKKRINKGGERRPKDGAPVNIVQKKKEEEQE